MIDQDLIKRKLLDLERYIEALKPFQKYKRDELENSLSLTWTVEHGLQLAIQILIDVGNHILAAIGENEIEEYADVIEKLGKRSILPPEFAQKIRDMAGFRNILVHEYTQVDLGIVHRILQNRLNDFSQFSEYIAKYLRKVQ